MTIYNPLGTAIFEAPVTKDAIIKCVLMGDCYIELPFNLVKPQHFPRGSYIYYNGRKFEIMSNVRPEFDSKTGGYKYTLKFEAQQNHMKRRRTFWLKSKNSETTFHDTTFLADFGNLIADNMNKLLGGNNWKVAAIPDDLAGVAKLVSFNGDTCWNAINTIAETFECEWWTVENGNEVWLYFGKLEFGTPERFERGNVVTSIPAKKGDESNYGTRFYVFGSTRNIPEDYDTTEQGGTTNHVSEKRLHLPTGMQYIDAWENIAPADIVEQVAFFDDIYPTSTETVTNVETVKRKVENSEDKDRTFDAYVMYCKDSPFLPCDMIIGETLGCKFTSGPLNGREFELDIRDANDNKYNPETWKPADGFIKKFEIIADVETYGDEGIVTIPNASLHPEPGDTFVLTGITLPKERIAEAENKLLEVGKSWAKKNSSNTDVYDCPTNPVYCTRHDKNYKLGQKVVLIDADRFGAEGRVSRIQGFEKKLWNEYSATYTVGDNTAYSRLGSIESNIEEAAYAERIGVISGVGIYLIRSKYDQTQPTDYNAYSAAAVEAFFLSKIKGGTINAPVYFKKNIIAEDSVVSKDFKEGYFAGAGFRLGKDANGASVLEVDNAIIRKKAVFNEVVINQISFTVGETIFSNGGCECTAIEELDDRYRCFYDNKDGRRYSGLVVGDQVRCQRYDPTQHTIVKYYWRLVVGIGDDYVDLSKTDCDGSDIPEVGDNLVQFGHRTDVSRQSAIVINPLNGGSVEAFAGIDSYTLSEKNRIGMGVNPTTGKAYLYGYGDLYFGDRDMTDPNSTWITFQQKEGTDRPKLYIKGNIEMGPDTTGLQNITEFKNLENKVDKIDSIQIGGRNMLTGTKGFVDGWQGDGTLQPTTYQELSVVYADASGAANWIEVRYQTMLIFPNTEYTLSFYAKGEGALTTYAYPNTGTTILATNGAAEFVGQLRNDGRCEYPLTEDWKRYFVTFRTTDDPTKINPSGTNKNILFRAMSGNIIYICGAKLEKGNVPSDWSPAPEDNNEGLQFIKQIFPDGLVNNAATVSQLLAVRDEEDKIVAGIYGGGAPELEADGFKDEEHGKLMIFAGADNISDKEKVEDATTRIYEDGTIITNKLEADKAQITAAEIKDSNLTEVTVSGTIRSPFQPFDGSIYIDIGGGEDEVHLDYNSYDNVACANFTSSWGNGGFDVLKWDKSQNGRTLTFVNYKCNGILSKEALDLSAPSGCSFFENGYNPSSIVIRKGELVQLKGYGEGDTFYGWIVLSRAQLPGYVAPQTGFQLKPRHIDISTTISTTDSVLFVTANVTLMLPSKPEDGQMYFIKNITRGSKTTLKPGSSDHYINDGQYNKKTSWTWSEGTIVIVIWDALNQTWQAGYTNNN